VYLSIICRHFTCSCNNVFKRHNRASVGRNLMNSVVAITPRANDNSVLQRGLVIALLFNDGSRLVTTHKFVYLLDPRITSVQPSNHLIACVMSMCCMCRKLSSTEPVDHRCNKRVYVFYSGHVFLRLLTLFTFFSTFLI